MIAIADQLEWTGKANASNVALLYASFFKAFGNLMASSYPKAMKYALQALSQSNQWHINNNIPEIYNIIGNIYKENLDYPKALDAIAKAFRFFLRGCLKFICR